MNVFCRGERGSVADDGLDVGGLQAVGGTGAERPPCVRAASPGPDSQLPSQLCQPGQVP